MRRLTRIIALGNLLSVAAGCALNKTEKGAIIGAAAGTAAGAVIGDATGSTARGAIVGAAVGGAAGAVIGHYMDQQAAELAHDIPGATVQRVGEGIAVTFPEGLLFPFNSDQLKLEARTNLRNLAMSLKKYPKTNTMIVGHTDSKGTAEYNQGLSERRARSAANFLAAEGVPRERLATAGRGESESIASNDTEAGRARNRRVEVAIYADEAFKREAQAQSHAQN
jgi:outer membrane protein OmpA-like peptidoglycan-associated protein